MTAEPKRHPVRLRKLSIRNFRGIDSLDLDFVDPQGDHLDREVQEDLRRLRGGNGGPPPDRSRSPFSRLQRFWDRLHLLPYELAVVPIDDNPASGDEIVLKERRPIPSDVISLAMARQLAPS